MNESEQAQAIAEIKWRHKIATDAYNTTRVILDIGALLEIVDSQSQKIAEQAKEIERLRI